MADLSRERLGELAEALDMCPLAWDFFPEPDAAIETILDALAPLIAGWLDEASALPPAALRIAREAGAAEVRARVEAAVDRRCLRLQHTGGNGICLPCHGLGAALLAALNGGE